MDWLKKRKEVWGLPNILYVKSFLVEKESIEQKLIRRGYESDVESARDCLTDISGIRVICYFVRDIYAVVSLLKKQTDIVVIKGV